LAIDEYTEARLEMVQIVAAYAAQVTSPLPGGRLDERLLSAMARLPRHEFVPDEMRPHAYTDGPLPIGFDKTVSQPFMAALMTALLDIRAEHTVLEIGTGLGYHAALLAALCHRVYTVEIIEELAAMARANLDRFGGEAVESHIGDGSRGWVEFAPYDRILVAAGTAEVPEALLEQLSPRGRMVIPLGTGETQMMTLVEKGPDGGMVATDILPVRFAPLESYN
jgi:protein-L-isoaspartate(D-aspartate) O-methyltransferase